MVETFIADLCCISQTKCVRISSFEENKMEQPET